MQIERVTGCGVCFVRDPLGRRTRSGGHQAASVWLFCQTTPIFSK